MAFGYPLLRQAGGTSLPDGRRLLVCLAVFFLLIAALNGCAGSEDSAGASDLEYVSQGNFEDEPESPVIVDCAAGQPHCRELLDCNNGEVCLNRSISFDVDACSKTEQRAKCENFDKRLQRVTLVSDSYNFIDSPFTKEALAAEFIMPLKRPWDLAFLPDDSLLVTQLSGEILRIRDGEVKQLTHDLDILQPPGNSGLLGLAIDPDFAENHFIYLAYTHAYFDEFDPDRPGDRRLVNRVSRLTLEDGRLIDEMVLLDRVPASLQHAGSRLEIGPDGKLYMTTGDADQDAMSQLKSFMGGKILRMNRDGTIPKDNPFPGSYIYSLGHRNPQGLAWDSQTGELYASEHGPRRYDEINRIRPGMNYGWGSYRCDDRSLWGRRKPSGEYVFPLVCPKYWNLSPSGMAFVSDPDSPWYGSLFVASLRGKHLHRYVFDGDKVEIDEIFYVVDNEFQRGMRKGDSMSQRMRDVEYHNGALYIIGDGSGLVKISPAVTQAAPPEEQASGH